VAEWVAWAAANAGPSDILVYSAGVNVRRRTFADIDPADFDRVTAPTATGALNCMHALLPAMRAQDGPNHQRPLNAGIEDHSSFETARVCSPPPVRPRVTFSSSPNRPNPCSAMRGSSPRSPSEKFWSAILCPDPRTDFARQNATGLSLV
jgi:NAD(P)-dependent dehydrogenase (short-subunit alcohol dehydrogenase family)